MLMHGTVSQGHLPFRLMREKVSCAQGLTLGEWLRQQGFSDLLFHGNAVGGRASRFGHPKELLLDNREVFLLYYCCDDVIRGVYLIRLEL